MDEYKHLFITIGFVCGGFLFIYSLFKVVCFSELSVQDLKPNLEYNLAKYHLARKQNIYIMLGGLVIIAITIGVLYA